MSSRSSKKTSSERRARRGRGGEATRPEPADIVEVGRIVRPHGVRGEAVVESFSDVPDRFAPGRELRALPPEGAPRRLTIASVRAHRGVLLARFAEVADREEVEALRGTILSVGRDEVPEAPEGTYYYFQLVGCRVRDVREGDLGEVVDLVEDGGGVLLIVDDGARRVPIPFVRDMVRRVEPGGPRATGPSGPSGPSGSIELELPEGLLEICASRS